MEINNILGDDNFWNNREVAIKLLKDREEMTVLVQKLQKVSEDIKDFQELLEIINDTSELKTTLSDIEKTLDVLEKIALFTGKYDENNTILTIRAGAGGTDAQDWASIILRMYVLWSENNNYKVNIIEKINGTEAGIKNATLEIKGIKAYGKLKSESGVHRLVRLSPFNSDNLRQTSFTEVEVLPVVEFVSDFIFEERNLRIDTFRASGAGGQHVNTTDSAVRVTHLPTNTVASCQNERSQLRNKENAIKLLKIKLNAINLKKEEKEKEELRGVRKKVEWGSQIRSYTLHPYKLVKDHRTKYETTNISKVLDGDIDDFIYAFLQMQSKNMI